jgi:DNA-directed RNA polymerase specialized sigma24 family protein
METTTGAGGIDRRVMNNIRFNARRLARAQLVPGMAVEDYEQDLVLDLLHRRRSFDPRRASFTTFADRIVGHRISTLASPTLRLQEERRAVSLDAPIEDEDGNEVTLLDLLPDARPPVDESVAIRIDVARFVDGLTPPLADCCEVLLADSISEGARAAGLHRSTVYDRIAAIRAIARDQGLGIYVNSSPDTSGARPVGGEDRGGAMPTSAFDQEEHTVMNARPKFATIRLTLTEVELCGWLGQAVPGDTLEYFRGFLVVDTTPYGSRLPENDRVELGRLARRALWASERGLAHLVQRRHGPDDYSYVIIARARPTSQALSELLAGEVA